MLSGLPPCIIFIRKNDQVAAGQLSLLLGAAEESVELSLVFSTFSTFFDDFSEETSVAVDPEPLPDLLL